MQAARQTEQEAFQAARAEAAENEQTALRAQHYYYYYASSTHGARADGAPPRRAVACTHVSDRLGHVAEDCLDRSADQQHEDEEWEEWTQRLSVVATALMHTPARHAGASHVIPRPPPPHVPTAHLPAPDDRADG